MKKFTASNFRNECTIDEDFEPSLIKMNAIAQKYHITVIVNSSYRVDANVLNAIVTPAKQSNHMVGHAIDCNLERAGAFYNSKLMKSDTGVIRQFINEVKAAGLRWGGDFSTPDPVHFDDGLNKTNTAAWTAKFNKLHGIHDMA